MSSLYLDTDVWGVVITTNAKSGSGTKTINAAFDYWAGATIYSSNSTFYPLLVEPPQVKRTVGQFVFVRQDVSIRLYAKTDFEEHGKSLGDLLELYEINGAAVSIYYWVKPADAVGAHVENTNKRMVCKVINVSYDDVEGIISLQCRDTSFEDKEISKVMTALELPSLDERVDGAIGGTVFGKASASGSGLYVASPFFDSQIVSNTPVAKAFTGWTYPGHDMQAASLWVRNQTRVKSADEWLSLTLAADPQTAAHGAAGLTDLSSPYTTRYLSWYSRGMTFTVSGGAEVVTAARSRLRHPNPLTYPAATFDGSSAVLSAAANRAHEITEDGITICGWFYLSAKTSNRALVSKYATSTRRDYWLYYDSGADRFKFEVFGSGGTSLATATASTFGSPSTNTWYFICCRYVPADTTSELKISVNAGTEDTGNSTGTPQNSSAGLRLGARRGADYLNGRICSVGFWDNGTSTTLRDSIYNSSIGKVFDDLADSDKSDLSAWYDLSDFAGTRIDKGGNADLTATATVGGDKGRVVMPALTADLGEMVLRISFAKYNVDSDSYEPDGNSIREAKIEIEDINVELGVEIPCFQFDPPLVLEPATYFAELEWTGQPGNPRSMIANYKSQVGEVVYYKSKIDKDAGWKKSPDVQLDLEFFILGEGTDAFVASDGTSTYSYYDLEAKSITLTGTQTHKTFDNGIELRALVEGLKDDGSGTYTGSAGALIQYPADIARFVLLHDSFLNMASGDVDTASFDTVRTAQVAAGIKHQFVIDSTTTARDILTDLCVQGRMRLYKKHNGQIAVDSPVYSSIPDATLSEGQMRADLMLVTVADALETDAANDWHFLYDRDYLNKPKQLEFVRAAKTDKFFGLTELTPNASTDSDTFRVAKCSTSYTLYGAKEHRSSLDYIDDSAVALKLRNYIADRWTLRQKRVAVRIPMRDGYSSRDLFSKLRISHTGLPASQGTGFFVPGENSNNEVISYNEGTPVYFWTGGVLFGEVVDVVEQGGFMTLTIETVSPFSNT